MEEEFDIDVVFTPAMLGYKRKSDEVASTNNLSKWWQQSKTRIKNDFKNIVKEWYLPEWDNNYFRRAEVHFTILRTNYRKMDADSLGPSTYKWALDCLTEQGYIIDDDQCKVVLNPTLLGQSGNVETMVRMQVKLLERQEMTVDELRDKVATLQIELQTRVGQGQHVKVAAMNVIKIIEEIRNSTPQLTEDLKEMNK